MEANRDGGYDLLLHNMEPSEHWQRCVCEAIGFLRRLLDRLLFFDRLPFVGSGGTRRGGAGNIRSNAIGKKNSSGRSRRDGGPISRSSCRLEGETRTTAASEGAVGVARSSSGTSTSPLTNASTSAGTQPPHAGAPKSSVPPHCILELVEELLCGPVSAITLHGELCDLITLVLKKTNFAAPSPSWNVLENQGCRTIAGPPPPPRGGRGGGGSRTNGRAAVPSCAGRIHHRTRLFDEKRAGSVSQLGLTLSIGLHPADCIGAAKKKRKFCANLARVLDAYCRCGGIVMVGRRRVFSVHSSCVRATIIEHGDGDSGSAATLIIVEKPHSAEQELPSP